MNNFFLKQFSLAIFTKKKFKIIINKNTFISISSCCRFIPHFRLMASITSYAEEEEIDALLGEFGYTFFSSIKPSYL